MWQIFAMNAVSSLLGANAQNKQIKAYNAYARAYNKNLDNNAVRQSETAGRNYITELRANSEKERMLESDKVNQIAELAVQSALVGSDGDSATKAINRQLNVDADKVLAGINSERKAVDSNYVNQLWGIQAQADASKMNYKSKVSYGDALVGSVVQSASQIYGNMLK